MQHTHIRQISTHLADADDLTPVGTAVHWQNTRYVILTNVFQDEDGSMVRIVKRCKLPKVLLWVPQRELELIKSAK